MRSGGKRKSEGVELAIHANNRRTFISVCLRQPRHRLDPSSSSPDVTLHHLSPPPLFYFASIKPRQKRRPETRLMATLFSLLALSAPPTPPPHPPPFLSFHCASSEDFHFSDCLPNRARRRLPSGPPSLARDPPPASPPPPSTRHPAALPPCAQHHFLFGPSPIKTHSSVTINEEAFERSRRSKRTKTRARVSRGR